MTSLAGMALRRGLAMATTVRLGAWQRSPLTPSLSIDMGEDYKVKSRSQSVPISLGTPPFMHSFTIRSSQNQCHTHDALCYRASVHWSNMVHTSKTA